MACDVPNDIHQPHGGPIADLVLSIEICLVLSDQLRNMSRLQFRCPFRDPALLASPWVLFCHPGMLVDHFSKQRGPCSSPAGSE